MHVIDMGPEDLRMSADSAIHSGIEARLPMRAEFAGDIDGLMGILVRPGPCACTNIRQFLPDGSAKSPPVPTGKAIPAIRSNPFRKAFSAGAGFRSCTSNGSARFARATSTLSWRR